MGYDCCSSGMAGHCGSCYSSSSSGAGYSALESSVQQYQGVSAPAQNYDSVSFSLAKAGGEQELIPSIQSASSIFSEKAKPYSVGHYSDGAYLKKTASAQKEEAFTPSVFLNPDRPFTKFVGESREIEEDIKEAFRLTAGKELPEDIMINICSRDELRMIHELNHGVWDDAIQGFAINRKGRGMNEVFVGRGELAHVMLTLGHEIGHVLSHTLPNPVDEEAKAFAFSLAWMNAIHEHNIAGLTACINPTPAENGVHNRAFNFVVSMIEKGKKAIDVYSDMISRSISTLSEEV
jgi:hypothetical protein